ncbi:SNF-related serine/threonine-protein kinase-like isoform X1 [Paramormyrops kingsleyae]|uniref:SNF-related serine/threonine-protein kinase-like isoform X1 n=1 Tax=Paramormyrops kingsleyae TaxID=1676925 RepID=UPI003B9702CC
MAGFKRGYDGKIAGLYDLDKTLGRGHFAVVKLARHVFTGEKVAVKVIDKTKLDSVATGHLFQEVRCMKLVQHPNIVRLYEVIDTQTKLYLILELGDGGDMFDYIMKHEEGLSEELAKRYFAQIVHAISYCHRLHVVHRDLKPENVVFFEKQGLVKLTDFGFSNKFQPGKKLTTSCGSLAYSAPEILLGDEYDAPAVDIWSLGVILFMLVCGQPPFQEANDSETLTMIMDCKYTVPAHISLDCKEARSLLVLPSAWHRGSSMDIPQEPSVLGGWTLHHATAACQAGTSVRKGLTVRALGWDLINRMLQRDPKRRASLDEIERHAWLRGVDPSPATKYSAPLVSHKSLSEEEHNGIIQRMVLGDIADREAITEALETNKYNHITATYFLLAERILREKQEKEMQNRSSSPSNIKAQFRQSWPTKIDMHQDIDDSLAGPSISHPGGPQSPARSTENLLNGHRSKGLLDLGRREEPTEPLALPVARPTAGPSARPTPSPPKPLGTTPPTVPAAPCKPRTCLCRVEEDEEEEEEQEPLPLPTQVVLRRKPPNVPNRLSSRKSAPVLKQIFEEGESDDDFDMEEGLPPKLSRLKMSMASPGTAHKRFPRRKSQGRGSSCSSSETSDDDSESHRRRLDKDPGLTYGWNRRDSSEGPPGNPGGNGAGPSGPPTEGGNAGPDRGSPPTEGEGGSGGGGGDGGNRGQGNPTNCSSHTAAGSAPGSVKTAGGLVESLKLMSLCLSSQFRHLANGGGSGNGGKFIIDPRGIPGMKTQERSPWRMCVSGSSGSLDRVSLLGGAASGARADPSPAHARAEPGPARENSMNLKNKVLQLPLSDKTISVNIQRNPEEGLLCTSGQASCCQVI